MLNGMSDSIQPSRIENLHSTEVDRQSPTGLIFIISVLFFIVVGNGNGMWKQLLIILPLEAQQ